MITITIKGLSKQAHQALKKRAMIHGRSLNTEAISVLESSVRSRPADARALLARAKTAREMMTFKGKPLDVADIIRKTRDSR